MAQPLTTPAATSAALSDVGASYVDWRAIIAGAVLATAISFVLITFGAAVGLSSASVEAGEGVSLLWLTIAAGIWFVWVVVSSNVAGGYLAGRLRRRVGDATEDEAETRDGAHGLLVWALGALLGATLATSGLAGLARGASSTAGAVAESAGGVAGALGNQVDYFAGLAGRAGGGAVIDSETRAEVASIMMRGVGGGEVDASDRQYLIDLVAERTGADAAQVETQVDAAFAQFDQAREAAVDAAETARVAGVISAFLIAATMIVSAGVAYLAATFGGVHRDRGVAFRALLR